ncbi:flavin reductase family protein [Streptomyces sp. B1I3]|uniref:flavin reductase family protein n=1 Tax=Streptomyces sp. B1I3 TaxID=3042264 RepID=UPI0027843FD3|nr:flavin reductase family protein [Streptomyces sp. B1I3]MDQ0793130.1 flavin reductase (DIM6/NTAB) family NADH-FMN oxidoreductase RutF [Streptomyces sp. B1I3]
MTVTVSSYAAVQPPAPAVPAAPAGTPGIAAERFKQAFRRYPSGVVVVTADAGRGPVGFTATSLTSLSLTPPLVSFGIGTSTSSWPHIERAATAVVNFLGAEQEALATTFATSGIDRFAAPTRWSRLAGGEPVLDGVTGWLRLTLRSVVPAGDHRIVVARVEESWLDEGRSPLLFHDGSYHSIRPAPDQ